MRPSCCADSSLCSLRPGGPKGPWMADDGSARHPSVWSCWNMAQVCLCLYDLTIQKMFNGNLKLLKKTCNSDPYAIKIRLLRTSENHCNIKQPQISQKKRTPFLVGTRNHQQLRIATTQSITALPGIQQNCMGSPGSSKASSATSQQEMNISSLMPQDRPALDMAMQNGTSMAQWTCKFC